jgi:hypothetical protein
MPSWKKVILSGSDASLNSLSVATNVTATSFTGSLLGTSSFATSASFAPNIYNSDGVITAPRIVTLDGENLTFETQTGGGFDINLFDTGSFNVNYIDNQSAFRITSSPTQTVPKLLGLDSDNRVVNMATSSIQNVISSSFATTASYVATASYAISASRAITAECSDEVEIFNYDQPDPGNYYYTNVLSTSSVCQTINTLDEFGLYYNATTSRNVSPVDLQGNLIGTASFALTASHGASNFTTAGNVFINGFVEVESISLVAPNSLGFSTTSASSSAVPNGNTVTLFTIGTGGFEAVFLDYVVFNSARTNKRTGNFRINFDLIANAVTFDETSTKDIGNTSGFTLFAEVVGSVMSMKATNNTGQNVQIVYERKILYVT